MKAMRLALLLVGIAVCASDEPSAEADLVVRLNERNFEHLTQAATGATTGEWIVNFCKFDEDANVCKEMDALWTSLAQRLDEMLEENPDGPRINVASVDLDKSAWLSQRFQIQHSPTVLLFRHGWMHLFNKRLNIHRSMHKATGSDLIAFIEKGWAEAPSMPVPPEPHVPTEHELTFNYFVGGTCVLCALCFVIDLGLAKRNKAALAAAQNELHKSAKPKSKDE